MDNLPAVLVVGVQGVFQGIVPEGCKHSTLTPSPLREEGALVGASLGTSHLSPRSCEILPSVGRWLLLLLIFQDVTSAEVTRKDVSSFARVCICVFIA